MIMRMSGMAGAMVAVLVAAGCGPNPNPLDELVVKTATIVPGLPPGFHCPLVPSGFDPVGSIYRVDRVGTYYRVKDFRGDPAVQEGRSSDVQVANYVLSDTQKSNAGLSFALLQNALPGLTADGSADFSKDISVAITVEDIKADILYDTAADHIVDWFRKNIEPKPGSTYFLVRETIQAGAVSYSLKAKDIAKLGGKAQVAKIADGKANLTVRDNDGSFEIKQKFDPRIHVCIKSAEIAIDRGRGAAPVVKAALKPVEDSRQPVIKRVGTEAAQ